jgi:hypothetical protein
VGHRGEGKRSEFAFDESAGCWTPHIPILFNFQNSLWRHYDLTEETEAAMLGEFPKAL